MEKARRPSLEPGFSLLHWQKLSMDADLTGGVGKADPDDEASWRAWPRAEIRKHSTRDDFWTIIRGKVYNLTQYLPYHPGGVDILMSTAGRDGTALFDKHHSWVSEEALLEACFIGVVAPEENGAPSSPPSPPAAAERAAAKVKWSPTRITWDEANLAANDATLDELRPFQKIALPETPFLYYNDGQGNEGVGSYYNGEHNGAGEPSVSIHSNYLPNFLPPEAVAAEKKSAAGPRQMSVDALRQMLGQLETDDDGRAAYHPKYAAGEMDDYFEAKRQALYAGEARVAAASAGLPDGWVAQLSTSEPREVYFVHEASGASQWERPTCAVVEPVDVEGVATFGTLD